MSRTMLMTPCRRLPAFDFSFLIVAMVFLMPLLWSGSTLDPALTPRFLLWVIALFVILLSFSAQAATGSLRVDRGLPRHAVFLAFLGYLLSGLASLVQAVNLGETLFESAKIFMSVVFLPASIIILSRKSTHIPNLAKAVVLSATALALIGLYQYVRYDSVEAFRHFAMTGTMGNKNMFASALFLMLPFCLYTALGFRGFWRLAGVCATGAILVAVLLSRTRAVWLALCVSCVLTAALLLLRVCRYRPGFSEDMRRNVLRGACQIMIVILVLGGSVGLRCGRARLVTDFRSAALDTTSIHHRLWLWNKTLTMIGDHWVWGVGLGNWKIVVPSYGVPEGVSSDWFKTTFPVRPHNDFLWVLSETGALGFCFYASIFVVVLFYLLRLACRPMSGDEGLLSLSMFFGITGYLVVSMFCFPRERVFHSVFLLLMISIVHVVYHRNVPSVGHCGRFCLGGSLALSFLLLPAVVALGCIRFHAEIHTRRALTARAAGDYRTVVTEIDEAYSPLFTLDPASTPLKWYRGEAHFLSGGFSEALDDYEQALADHPHHIHVLNNLATCCQAMGHRDRAIRCYQRLLHIFPGFAEAACNLAAVHFNAGEYEKARDVLLRCDPARPSPLVERYCRVVAERMEREGSPSAAPEATHQSASTCEPTPSATKGLLHAVHRLWSATHGRYLHTIDPGERDAFLARRDETWVYEGIDCYAFADNCLPGLSPVHRFYSPDFRAYFYTIQPAEVQSLADSRDGPWQHQGVAFFAFPAGRQPADASPVYRFWSGTLRYHFFTIDPQEKDRFCARYSDTWTAEGVAWYAYR